MLSVSKNTIYEILIYIFRWLTMEYYSALNKYLDNLEKEIDYFSKKAGIKLLTVVPNLFEIYIDTKRNSRNTGKFPRDQFPTEVSLIIQWLDKNGRKNKKRIDLKPIQVKLEDIQGDISRIRNLYKKPSNELDNASQGID